MKTKICTKCKKEKSIDQFYSNKTEETKKDNYCSQCRREYNKNYYKSYNKKKKYEWAKRRNRKRTQWLNKIKIEKGCQICGYNRCPEALEFHHENNNEKNLSIGHMKKFSESKILEEIKKCIVLCANCHRELHYKLKVDSLTG